MFMNIFRSASHLSFQTSKFQFHLRNFKCDTTKIPKSLNQMAVEMPIGLNKQKQVKIVKNLLKNKRSVVAAYQDSDSYKQKSVILEICYQKDQIPENQIFVKFIQKFATRVLKSKDYAWDQDQLNCQQKIKQHVNAFLQNQDQFQIFLDISFKNAHEQFKHLIQKLGSNIGIRKMSTVNYYHDKIHKQITCLGVSVDGDSSGGIGNQAVIVSVQLDNNGKQPDLNFGRMTSSQFVNYFSSFVNECSRSAADIASKILNLQKAKFKKSPDFDFYGSMENDKKIKDAIEKRLKSAEKKATRDASYTIQQYYQAKRTQQ